MSAILRRALFLCGSAVLLPVTVALQLTTTPLNPTFGAIVRGIDLCEEQPAAVVAELRSLLAQYRMLVFRQGADGLVLGEQQVAISQWFGELDCCFMPHPASPHPGVFRLSNDPCVHADSTP